MNTPSVSNEAAPARRSGAVIAGAVLGVALTASNAFLLTKTNRMEDQMQSFRDGVKSDIANVELSGNAKDKEHRQSLEALRIELEQTGAKSAKAASQAGSAAKRYSDQLAKRMVEQEQAQQSQHQQLVSQLGEIKDTTAQIPGQLNGIASDVNGVKREVASTRSELDKTVGELRSVRGDMGVQSGLIATNAKELAALRSLGERNYFEFQITKSKAPQKVGDVAVQLKKFDARRNRYTIELIADDKRVEKRDRTVNEPVQFYSGKARLPYEIVVNEVRNDRIVGYMAAPKVKEMR